MVDIRQLIPGDTYDALIGANSPSASNVFATMNDITGGSTTMLEPVISRTNTPPGGPVTGDRYLINTAPTGAWAGHANEVAEWNGASWDFTVPVLDNTVFVTDTLTTLRYNGSSWVSYIGTAALLNGNSINATMIIGTNTVRHFVIKTSNTYRVCVTSGGNLNVLNKIYLGPSLTASPAASAKFEISSTTQGMLFSRMTTAQKNAIASPATSLWLFDTNENRYNYWDGAAWQSIYPGQGWALNGNTVGSEKFLGTLDNFDLPIRVNNTEKFRFVTDGTFKMLTVGKGLSFADNIGANEWRQYTTGGKMSFYQDGIGDIAEIYGYANSDGQVGGLYIPGNSWVVRIGGASSDWSPLSNLTKFYIKTPYIGTGTYAQKIENGVNSLLFAVRDDGLITNETGDFKTTVNTKGFVVKDRTNGNNYRIYTDAGVIQVEAE